MKALLEMLANSAKEKEGSDEAGSRSSDGMGASGGAGDAETDGSEGEESSEAFQHTAQQAMDALQSGNAEEFAEALKACIEMVG